VSTADCVAPERDSARPWPGSVGTSPPRPRRPSGNSGLSGEDGVWRRHNSHPVPRAASQLEPGARLKSTRRRHNVGGGAKRSTEDGDSRVGSPGPRSVESTCARGVSAQRSRATTRSRGLVEREPRAAGSGRTRRLRTAKDRTSPRRCLGRHSTMVQRPRAPRPAARRVRSREAHQSERLTQQVDRAPQVRPTAKASS